MKLLPTSSCCLFLLIWLTAACVEHTVYHSYQSIPQQGWSKGDTLTFQIPITDSVPTTLELTAQVRNYNCYLYQNLFLVIAHNLQDSSVFQTDTIEFLLADKEGNWKGGGWSSLIQASLPLGRVVSQHAGNYAFKICHGMKDEKLKGVRDVGIHLRK